IISCRGLCLTNWQEEVAECFTPGEEIIVYQELEEIRELAAFFVQHDTERRRIAENGYERLRREHTIPARLEMIL
ncbi:MAG: glycosyltransferase family 1 protein, partial [Lachnospiraceae bacterium]|nr:glycosyltransferase family 1 protein [Lachnospiraceae bacterium]